MNFLHEPLAVIHLVDKVLRTIIEVRTAEASFNEDVTLKDIYGLAFWEALTTGEKQRFGYRFRFICEGLGFSFTGKKRGNSNLYTRLN